MTAYLIRRLLVVIPTVWGALTALFLVFFVLPGDRVDVIVGGERAVSEVTRQQIIERYGFDEPVLTQYGDYLGRVVRGDLGESYQTGRSVISVLRDAAPASLRLAFWAIVIEVVIGVAAGLVSAVRRYSFLDAVTTVSTTMVVAIPVFVSGYLLQYLFGVLPFQRGWPDWLRFPVQGIGPNRWALGVIPLGDQWRYLLLPALTLASVSTAVVARMMRSTMLEVLRADYMRTAAAKGLRHRQVILRHGLRNALIPVVTLIGLDLATVIGSAVLTETVFNWPGIGSQVAVALLNRDAPIVLGLSLVLVVAYALINLLVDLSYALFDPRIRLGARR